MREMSNHQPKNDLGDYDCLSFDPQLGGATLNTLPVVYDFE